MKKLAIAVLLIAILIGGFLIFSNSQSVSKLAPDNSPSANLESGGWESKTDDQASVTVTVTPIDLSVESREWKFIIALETHSVELDQDMTGVAVLIDDSGQEYTPTRWEGPEPGGHHREGVLVFSSITPYPQHLRLKIGEIGGVERLFSWALIE